MKKLIHGALSAALAALVFASTCMRQSSQRSPVYAKFAVCPALPEQSITQRKEMVEIQRETPISLRIKVHLEKPFLGSTCYVGSSRRNSNSSAPATTERRGLCTGAEVETNLETDSFHEQNQLKPLLA
jgi:hypothetical protein